MAGISSCTRDEVAELQNFKNAVSINFMLSTDGNDCTTRAISDGTSADMLYYAIFTESGEIVIPKATKKSVSGIVEGNGFIMTITLPEGLNYKAVFWAQNSSTKAYSISEDMNVSVDYTTQCRSIPF